MSLTGSTVRRKTAFKQDLRLKPLSIDCPSKITIGLSASITFKIMN